MLAKSLTRFVATAVLATAAIASPAKNALVRLVSRARASSFWLRSGAIRTVIVVVLAMSMLSVFISAHHTTLNHNRNFCTTIDHTRLANNLSPAGSD